MNSRSEPKFLYGAKKLFYMQMVDALGYRGDEGRGVPAISLGEVASNL